MASVYMCVYIYSDAPSQTVTGNTEATGEEGEHHSSPSFQQQPLVGFGRQGPRAGQALLCRRLEGASGFSSGC